MAANDPGIAGSTSVQVKRTVAAPGAGNEWSYTVPPNTWSRVVSGFATFTASAVVASRYLGMRILDNAATEINENISTLAVTTGITQKVGYVRGNGASFTAAVLGLTPTNLYVDSAIILMPGWVIQSITVNRDVGDNYSAVNILMEEWTNNPPLINPYISS